MGWRSGGDLPRLGAEGGARACVHYRTLLVTHTRHTDTLPSVCQKQNRLLFVWDTREKQQRKGNTATPVRQWASLSQSSQGWLFTTSRSGVAVYHSTAAARALTSSDACSLSAEAASYE